MLVVSVHCWDWPRTGPIVSVPHATAKPEAQHEEEEWLERKRWSCSPVLDDIVGTHCQEVWQKSANPKLQTKSEKA